MLEIIASNTKVWETERKKIIQADDIKNNWFSPRKLFLFEEQKRNSSESKIKFRMVSGQ